MIQTIGFIGSGNVATNLALSFAEIGIEVKYVFSKSKKNRNALAHLVNAATPDSIDELPKTEVIFVCVGDDQISDISNALSTVNALVVHCSGTVELQALDANEKRGVFYPFQSISKFERTNWKEVPILIEANTSARLETLHKLANKISNKVLEISSVQRKQLHLSGVLMNNFTNHLAVQSRKFLEDNNLPPSLLNPLLKETIRRITLGNPEETQTGPAFRNDNKTIESQLKMLENNQELKDLYQLFTKSIQNWKPDKK